jgi:hypothetical protein
LRRSTDLNNLDPAGLDQFVERRTRNAVSLTATGTHADPLEWWYLPGGRRFFRHLPPFLDVGPIVILRFLIDRASLYSRAS